MRRAPGLLALSAVALAAPGGAQPRLLPQPAVPPPREVTERGPSPVYYRLPPDVVRPLVRTTLGASIRLPVGGAEGAWAFAFDALLGAEVGFGRAARYALLAEVGYAYTGFSEHWLAAGVGLVARRFGPTLVPRDGGAPRGGDVAVGVAPRVLVGALDGALGTGLRATLFARFWLYGVELGYQYATPGAWGARDGGGVHEVRLALTFFSFTSGAP